MPAKRLRRVQRSTLALLLILTLPACGTIMLRPRQVVEVRSRPPGAVVRIENRDQTWETPARFRLMRRGGPYRIIVSKEGYRDRSVTLRQEISEWTWLGAMLTLGIGYIVDSMTGSKYDLEPSNIYFELLPREGAAPAP